MKYLLEQDLAELERGYRAKETACAEAQHQQELDEHLDCRRADKSKAGVS